MKRNLTVLICIALFLNMFSGISVLSSQQDEITLLVTPEAAFANVGNYYNGSLVDMSPVLVIMHYRGNKLIELSKDVKTITSFNSGYFYSALTGDFQNGDVIKAALLESFNSIRPLINLNSETVSGAEYKTDNSYVSFPSQDFYSTEEYAESYKVSLCMGDQLVDIGLHKNHTIYVNGLITAYEESLFYDCYGLIAFGNKDSDGMYNTVYISNYKNTVVDCIDHSTNTIIAKRGSNIEFGRYALLYDKMGNQLEWSALTENDVLSTKEMKSNKNPDITVYIATISREIAEGNITEINGDYSLFVINGAYYGIDKLLVKGRDLKLNYYGAFHLDIFNNIAFFEKDILHKAKYGYVIASDNSGIAYPRTQLKVFTENGIRILTAAETVEVTQGEIIHSYSTSQIKDIVKSNDFIIYTSNIFGEIVSIQLHTEMEGTKYLNNFNRYAGEGTGSYDHNKRAINVNGKTAVINERTFIISVPKITDNNYAVDDQCDIIYFEELDEDFENINSVSIYDVGSFGVAKAIVFDDSDFVTALRSFDASLSIVKDWRISTLPDGQHGCKTDMFQDGFLKNYYTVSNVNSFSEIGSIIIPRVNYLNHIVSFREIVKVQDNIPILESDFSDTGADKYYLGYVADYYQNRLFFDTGTEVIEFPIPLSIKFYRYMPYGPTYVQQEDLSYFDAISGWYEAGKLFVHTNNGEVKNLMFYSAH